LEVVFVSRLTRRLPALALVAVLATTILALVAVAPALAEGPQYKGVQLHSLWSDSSDEDMMHELDLAQNVGANVVRVDVAWSSLEQNGKGQYSDWYVARLDKFVNGADARGIKVIAMLWSSPCWASSAPDSKKDGCSGDWWNRGVTSYPPTHASDFGDAAKYLTSRYGTKLAALEVWNEPNQSYFFTAPDIAAAYAPILKAAYPAAKAGNADVPVLAGAFAFSDVGFLDKLYDQGIKGYYDGIAMHPYNEWRAPNDLWQPQWKEYAFLPGIQSIRDAQAAHGDSAPLWFTEFGWTTCRSGSPWCVSEEQQASYVPMTFALLNSPDYSYVKAAVAYNLRDKGTNLDDQESNFGLVKRDFTPKPAFAALKAQLAGSGSPAPATVTTDCGCGTRPPVTSPKAAVASLPTVKAAASVRGTTARTRTAKARLRVSLKVFVKRGFAYARGKAPRRSTVRIAVARCKGARKASTLRVSVRASASGRFQRKLGSSKSLSGCSVAASVASADSSRLRRA
jgi:hypothetical protein